MVLLLIETRGLRDCRKAGSFNYSTNLTSVSFALGGIQGNHEACPLEVKLNGFESDHK